MMHKSNRGFTLVEVMVALAIMLPLLTVFTNLLGIFGGAVVGGARGDA